MLPFLLDEKWENMNKVSIGDYTSHEYKKKKVNKIINMIL